MAEKETQTHPKDLIEPIPEEIEKIEKEINKSEELSELEISKKIEDLDKKEKSKLKEEELLSSWIPKTKLGKKVKLGEITDIDEVLSKHKRILEPEIIDFLIHPASDLLLIGQAKGKFGGGKRRAWRQTQKKTQEGNVLTFSSMVVIGDKKNHIGIGFGKAKETLPAREKALRKAKLNIIKINRGFEDPKDTSGEPHTVPFKVIGKCGSVRITLFPAPRGTGLVVSDECKKILRLAGIKDIYGKTIGQTKTTFNLAKACIEALSKTTKMKT